MVFALLIFLQVLAGVITSDGLIRSTPHGNLVMATLRQAGINILRWRASADCKKELHRISLYFGFMALAFVLIFYFFGVPGDSNIFRNMPGIFLCIGISCSIYLKGIRGNVKEMVSFTALFAVTPVLLYLIENNTVYGIGTYAVLSKAAAALLGISHLADIWMVIFLVIVSALGGFIAFVFGTLLLCTIPLIILSIISTSSCLSRKILKMDHKLIFFVSCIYSVIVSPILLALESKGVI
ncbi:hypothetical protein EDC52_10236 [Biostraticola tofi]|uniref:Uncharacterized protein n=2 Tax=Biostraticola tofi TaxID=466109 RepID=A0A4R3Z1F0_9GAMM|nr:hypothetical protein EDC52_10236 [Biostraticola tofi]